MQPLLTMHHHQSCMLMDFSQLVLHMCMLLAHPSPIVTHQPPCTDHVAGNVLLDSLNQDCCLVLTDFLTQHTWNLWSAPLWYLLHTCIHGHTLLKCACLLCEEWENHAIIVQDTRVYTGIDMEYVVRYCPCLNCHLLASWHFHHYISHHHY